MELQNDLEKIQLTSVKEFADELERMTIEYQAKIRAEGEAVLKKAFVQIFDDHPNLVGVRWRQYTPYFNDGDECVFGVCEPEYLLSNISEFEGIESDWDSDKDWSTDLRYNKYVEVTDDQKETLDRKGLRWDEYPVVDGERVYKEVDYNNPVYTNEHNGRYSYRQTTYPATGRYYIRASIPGSEVIANDVNEIFRIPDQVFKDVFGDHSMITVTRDGIDIESYDHD